MHILATATTTLEEIAEPIDLRQPPGDIAVLSFADSDLAGLAAAWLIERDLLPSVRFAHLRDLRHPMSVDLWIERVGSRTKVILVRLLGGTDWWRYGVQELAATARANRIALALLPGEDRDDPRLAQASTLPEGELDTLLNYFREGGRENLRALLRRLARHAGGQLDVPAPQPVPRVTAYLPDEGAVSLDRLVASLASHSLTLGTSRLSSPSPRLRGEGAPPQAQTRGNAPSPGAQVRADLSPQAGRGEDGRPIVPIIFYRALLLAADTAAIDALCAALTARGLAPAPLAVTSLKEREARDFVRSALARLKPAVIVTTTAFAAGGEPGEFPLDGPDVPVLQALIATTKRTAWRDSPRGLGAADLAMHVVLPELDGRVLAGAIAFKDTLPPEGELAFTAFANRPEPDRIDAVADRVAALARLRGKPRRERRVAILMPDYPGAPGRAGYAVGLDVPASVVALLEDSVEAGYRVSDPPRTSRALLDALAKTCATARLPLDTYARLVADLPCDAVEKIHAAWGDAACDPDVCADGFRFRVVRCGNAIVALPPDRGHAGSRRADYHDPALPPRHALTAFALWLRHIEKIDALVHMGAHGTLEWLPGKAIALTSACFPEALIGPLPVFYPFIVSNPGEAAQAKRRIAAVTIGHLPPALIAPPLSGDARDLERLVEEYVLADGLDRRRRERLARLIVETARRSGLAGEAGADADPDTALRRIDAWLCDLKDLAIKDGLHVYGRVTSPPPCGEGSGGVVESGTAVPQSADPPPRPSPTRGEGAEGSASGEREASAAAERAALLAALDGRRVAPGPAGAPDRGRRDVLPTGRNLFTADPRMLPTPTALDLGRLAADEVIRSHLQAHGEMPRALVIDLWGSATLRTGGEEIAQGLALMGCRPVWDQSGRVTGIEVLPPALVGRPRVDVTWRISGLFRDLFPAQIALIDAAVRTIAARDEGDDNPLAAACRASNDWAAVAGTAAAAAPVTAAAPARIFGTAPGAYGAGIEPMLGRETDREAIAAAYLAATSHAYSGAEGGAVHLPDAFTARVASADLLLHPSDDPARDLLEGAEDAAFVGGFAAAAASLGRAPDLIMLDTTDPQRPRARSLGTALARIVRARAINPRFIAGQMRHGPRGAAELAETVDRLVSFAQTTGAVASTLIDLVHDAYLADVGVRDFLLRENPAAARAIAERLDAARRNGWWHPRRNDIDAELRAVMTEARA